ncbi:MAG: methionine ABC transporter ATP-binding protein [Janthinobacterium lividum]
MIELRHLTKIFGDGPRAVTVLDRLDLVVPSGTITAVVGPSGAGKSTLAQCVTLLTRPTSGAVVVGGRDLTELGDDSLREARRRIGTIFQSDGLQTRRTAAENVELPLRYLGVVRGERRTRVAELLDRVGLGDLAHRYPHELSGGQRQRVGIARALALRPSVLLSDEATSGLDPAATASIVALLRELRDDLGLSILFITHEMDTIVEVADSVARLEAGRIVETGPLLDVLRNPGSQLGRALLPRRSVVSGNGSQVWNVHYQAAKVSGNWLSAAARELGIDLEILGASVSTVDGSTVGNATLGVPAGVDRDRLIAVLTGAGLHVEPAGDTTASSSGIREELDLVP